MAALASGPIVLAGTGSFAAVSQLNFAGVTQLAGTGALAATAARFITLPVPVVMAGAGSFTGSAFPALFGSATIAGKAGGVAIATMPNMHVFPPVYIGGTGGFTPNVIQTMQAAARIAGSGALTFWFRTAWAATATLQGAGHFTSVASYAWQVSAKFAGTGALHVDTFQAQFISALISGTGGSLTVDDALLNSIMAVNATLAGTGSYGKIAIADTLPLGPHVNIGSLLLYRAASGLEKAMADVDGERITAIPAELIKSIWDPYAIPYPLLPYLSWALGVTYWNWKWSETTKRNWTANQWLFKSLRGTLDGLEMAVDYAGRDVSPFGYAVTGVTRRPQAVFSGPALSKEQREEWLFGLPQVRVYYYRATGIAGPYKAFIGGADYHKASPNFNFEGHYIIPSIAKEHLTRKATWNVGGVDTDVPVVDYGSQYQLHIPAPEDGKVFCDRPFNLHRHYIPSTAWMRIYTIEPNQITPWRIPVGPTLQAIQAQPELVQIPGQRGLSVYTGSNYVHGWGSLMNNKNYFIPSTAYLRVFDRYAVFDGTTYPTRPNVQFMGRGRYGFPKFTAWADTLVTALRSKWAAGDQTLMTPKAHYWIPHDPEPMQLVMTAAEASRRMADKIMLHTGPRSRFVSGRPFFADVDSYVTHAGPRSLIVTDTQPDLTFAELYQWVFLTPVTWPAGATLNASSALAVTGSVPQTWFAGATLNASSALTASAS